MSDNFFLILIAISAAGLFAIIIMYYMLTKKMNKEDLAYVKELKKGTQKTGLSTEVIYQKLYVFYAKIPFVKRYLAKLRRRLEVLSISDEYLTIEGEKLSKSKGNYISIRELLDKYPADVIRYYLIINDPDKRDFNFTFNGFINAIINQK